MERVNADTIRFRLANANRTNVRRAAISVLDRIQSYPPHDQLAALSILWTRLCRAYGLHPGDVMAVSNNCFTDGERVTPEFRAIDRYIQNILPVTT